ncbi:MAG: helix-turn-helix domain-containing protein [Candidatus Kerfeldbacteria bacterium]|nr:helix-turn-helix domain-containing protein [Candidatus Kerfeldbacteria bacterium]
MDIQSVLEELGLKRNKGVVYRSALGVGIGSIADIAAKAKLPRTTVHEIAQQLVGMGLLTYTSKGRRRTYSVEPPEKLRAVLEERERNLKSILPELKLLLKTSGRRPRVRFYEGVEGVKTIFEDTLTTRDKPLRGILSMEDLYKVPGKRFMDDYVKRRIDARIKLHVIRSQIKEVEETWPTSEAEYRELRYAPQNIIFPMTMYIYDNKVGIIGTEKETFGMIIESEDFYQTQKNLFEVLWDVSRIGKRVDE